MMLQQRKQVDSRSGLLSGKLRDGSRRQLVLIVVYTILVFVTGVIVSTNFGGPAAKKIGEWKQRIALIPKALEAMGSKQPDVENLVIDIKFNHYSRLARDREDALARFHLEAGDDDYVPATLQHDGSSLKARVRLKGDWVDHFNSHKWSLRIRMKGDDTFLGMKQFSIQHPKTRNYISEWIYQQLLQREDVLALRYDFIKVTLNGDNHGIYALEEHFEKRLVENRSRPEGPIVRFDENLMYQTQLQYRPFRRRSPLGHMENIVESSVVNAYQAAQVDTFQTSRMLTDPLVRDQHTSAIHLLEAFRRGMLKTSEVFDTGKLARFFAVSDLAGANHATGWRNLRFYYNPITSLLEPIGYDGDAGELRLLSCMIDTDNERMAAVGERRGRFIKQVFSDTAFFEEYIRVLGRISDPEYLDEWLAENGEDLDQRLNLLYSEFPEYSFSEQVLYKNQEYIRTVLNPASGLHAYFRRSQGNRLELDLGNIQALPVEVLGVVYGDSLVDAPRGMILPGALLYPVRPVEYNTTTFELPEGLQWSDLMTADLKVAYRLIGTDQIRKSDLQPWTYLAEDFPEQDLIRNEPTFRTFDFLEIDDSTREIFIERGSWSVDRDLTIPAGYRVVAGEGTRLNLSNSATILSHSPLYFTGSEEEPILVHSEDGSGQGLAVFNAEVTSVLDYVSFQNLSNPSKKGWQLTGAVTFYESPLQVSHSKFIGSRSEDALHIVRSVFDIRHSVIGETMSDALDADFSEGTITDCRFYDTGNDAIDVSGSIVEIEDTAVNGSGDKAVSAGERSQVNASGINIRKAEIGVASKDSSTVTVVGMKISDSSHGLATFQKKSEFGPASMKVHQLTIENVGIPYLVEKESSLVVDGKEVEATEVGLKALLYNTEHD